MAPKEPGLNVKECDACKTQTGPFERVYRSGFALNICVDFRSCIRRQPPISEILK
jgi:hypothetical protein